MTISQKFVLFVSEIDKGFTVVGLLLLTRRQILNYKDFTASQSLYDSLDGTSSLAHVLSVAYSLLMSNFNLISRVLELLMLLPPGLETVKPGVPDSSLACTTLRS